MSEVGGWTDREALSFVEVDFSWVGCDGAVSDAVLLVDIAFNSIIIASLLINTRMLYIIAIILFGTLINRETITFSLIPIKILRTYANTISFMIEGFV